jgi:predicted nucleotidyltransferase
MDKLQISQIIKELISQGYPEPIIGGTCSLFLQGFDLEPDDIDLYYSISKEEFLDQVHYRRCPGFPISIDWNFYPNLDLEFQEIEINGVKLRVQKIEDVLNYKLEGLEEDYFPESKRDKHLRFFQKLISDPRVSDLKSRINQILNIMPKGYGKGPRKFEDLINQHPMDDKFVKSMEEDIKNDPNRKDELDFYKAIKGSDVFNCESGKVYHFIIKNGEKVRAFGKPMSDKRGKHTNVDMYSLWKCNGMNFGIIYDPWGGYAGAVGKKSDLKKIWDEASKTDKDWYDSLGSIKEQLFDAPDEVKAAFNTVVGWFDKDSNLEDKDLEELAKILKDIKSIKVNGKSVKIENCNTEGSNEIALYLKDNPKKVLSRNQTIELIKTKSI